MPSSKFKDCMVFEFDVRVREYYPGIYDLSLFKKVYDTEGNFEYTECSSTAIIELPNIKISEFYDIEYAINNLLEKAAMKKTYVYKSDLKKVMEKDKVDDKKMIKKAVKKVETKCKKGKK